MGTRRSRAVEKSVEKIFHDIKNRAFLSNASNLHAQLKSSSGMRNNQHVSKKEISKYLQSQEVHTLHKPVLKKIKRNHYNLWGANLLMEIDLADLTSLKKYNDGITFLLVAIDTFSKFTFVAPLRNKTAKEILKGFRQILGKCKIYPKTVQSDSGKEFKNKWFSSMLNHHNIKQNFNITNSPFKNAIIERMIRTLKERIFKYLTFTNKRRYIDILQQLVDNYNDTVHSTTKFRPNAAVSELNQMAVYKNIKAKYTKGGREKNIPAILSENDLVRIPLKKNIFGKGYVPAWSREIFVISRVVYKRPHPVYIVSDLHGREIDEKLYQVQLQKIPHPPYDIVLAKNNLKKNKKILVYRNNSRVWIDQSQLKVPKHPMSST
jgi:hypothetical protein